MNGCLALLYSAQHQGSHTQRSADYKLGGTREIYVSCAYGALEQRNHCNYFPTRLTVCWCDKHSYVGCDYSKHVHTCPAPNEEHIALLLGVISDLLAWFPADSHVRPPCGHADWPEVQLGLAMYLEGFTLEALQVCTVHRGRRELWRAYA